VGGLELRRGDPLLRGWVAVRADLETDAPRRARPRRLDREPSSLVAGDLPGDEPVPDLPVRIVPKDGDLCGGDRAAGRFVHHLSLQAEGVFHLLDPLQRGPEGISLHLQPPVPDRPFLVLRPDRLPPRSGPFLETGVLPRGPPHAELGADEEEEEEDEDTGEERPLAVPLPEEAPPGNRLPSTLPAEGDEEEIEAEKHPEEGGPVRANPVHDHPRCFSLYST